MIDAAPARLRRGRGAVVASPAAGLARNAGYHRDAVLRSARESGSTSWVERQCCYVGRLTALVFHPRVETSLCGGIATVLCAILRDRYKPAIVILLLPCRLYAMHVARSVEGRWP
ncbi:hypothetical protein Prum_037570 [Phytohabitans rumicis]|uniref:Uncharacterized protein n=1 Tax=Phytohabitans rumicis TaxID=1076125 RepID=A0A6V8LBS8_9ACTN|nr:hypothetical protein Prum_037570 [Phytohabitans rumicis]